MDCFKSCSEFATQAFCNKALSIKDQILALRMNISSTILQLESNPKMATDICLDLFLKDLNTLPGVVRSFERFYGSGGLMKFWKADEREEMVKAVEEINQAVKDFILLNNVEVNYDQWPAVQAGNKIYVPLKFYRYDNARLVAQHKDFLLGSQKKVNRRRQLVCCRDMSNRNLIEIVFLNLDTGELDKEFQYESERKLFPEGMTLDEYDNIYLGVYYREEGPEGSLGLFVEVFSHECHHHKTITVCPMGSTIVNSEYLCPAFNLSASNGKLCVTYGTHLWIFSSDSDQEISHKEFDVDIVLSWIHGDKIILNHFSNVVFLHSSLEIERTVDVWHFPGFVMSIDRRTGYMLTDYFCIDAERPNDNFYVSTMYGEHFQKITLPFGALKALGLSSDTLIRILPITGTIKDEMILIASSKDDDCSVYVVSE